MNLQLQILTSLSRLPDDLMMPLPTLWAEVRMATVPQPDRQSFDAALRTLEDDKRQIVTIRDDDRTRIKITGQGKARLAEVNS